MLMKDGNKLVKLSVATVGFLVLIVVFSCFSFRLRIEIDSRIWQLGIERAARNVGAEPTTEGIDQYIRESIQVGMSTWTLAYNNCSD